MTPGKDSISEQRVPLGNPLVGFLAALQFLSIFPAFIKRGPTPEELGRATAYFPLVGLGFGTILAASHHFLSTLLPNSIAAALVLTLWVLLSGALHLDGFLDTCDGLFGGRTPEKRLEIMKDERVGAFGLVGGIFLLLLKFTALSALPNPSTALLLAPTLSRWSLTVSIFVFPYARNYGLGRAMKDHSGFWQVLIASLITVMIAWLVGGVAGMLAILVSIIGTGIMALMILRRIPGMTGDTYGAINEIVELTILLVFSTG